MLFLFLAKLWLDFSRRILKFYSVQFAKHKKATNGLLTVKIINSRIKIPWYVSERFHAYWFKIKREIKITFITATIFWFYQRFDKFLGKRFLWWWRRNYQCLFFFFNCAQELQCWLTFLWIAICIIQLQTFWILIINKWRFLFLRPRNGFNSC